MHRLEPELSVREAGECCRRRLKTVQIRPVKTWTLQGVSRSSNEPVVERIGVREEKVYRVQDWAEVKRLKEG